MRPCSDCIQTDPLVGAAPVDIHWSVTLTADAFLMVLIFGLMLVILAIRIFSCIAHRVEPDR